MKLTTESISDSKIQKQIDGKNALALVKYSEKLLNSLPEKLKLEFETDGMNVFTKAILDAQGIEPRKINVVTDLVDVGIGRWDSKTRKLEVPDLDSVESMFINNFDAKVSLTESEVKDKLAKQISNPVQWVDSMKRLKKYSIKTHIEFGPGKVLSGLIKRIDRNMKLYQINSLSDLEKKF